MKKQEIDALADRLLRGDDFKLSQDTLSSLRNCPKEDLIAYHNGLGRTIRNSFGLWNKPWTPKLVDGVDESPDHPDAISQAIIEAAWAKLQKQ